MKRIKMGCTTLSIPAMALGIMRMENMYWIWVLIVGGLIGLVAGAITKRGGSMGWIANIIAGLVGSSLGQALLGSWGPSLAGMAIIPSLVGAIILVLIVSLIFGVKKDPA